MDTEIKKEEVEWNEIDILTGEMVRGEKVVLTCEGKEIK